MLEFNFGIAFFYITSQLYFQFFIFHTKFGHEPNQYIKLYYRYKVRQLTLYRYTVNYYTLEI